MVIGHRSEVVPAWTIRSVALRTRDGPDRLDHAYRRLLTPHPPDNQPIGTDMSSDAPASGGIPDARR